MIRYKLPDATTSAVTLGGREYKTTDGHVEIPAEHTAAHVAAGTLGLEAVAPAKPTKRA